MDDFVKYKWTHTFSSESDAMGTILRFHVILRDCPDYIKSRIFLYMDGSTVTLVEFVDSRTHVRVELDRAGRFSIKLFGDLETRKC